MFIRNDNSIICFRIDSYRELSVSIAIENELCEVFNRLSGRFCKFVTDSVDFRSECTFEIRDDYDLYITLNISDTFFAKFGEFLSEDF